MSDRVPLSTVAREWTRIGLIGFGGPPAHIALFRRLVVEDRGWLEASAFEDAIAACGLLPGPASTQLAILCAYRVAGPAGAIVGGLGFIAPAVILVLIAARFLLAASAPPWLRGAGAGAGAAVAVVALQAGLDLAGPSRARARARDRGDTRWAAYLIAGAVAAYLIGPYLVLVLIAAGAVELAIQRRGRPPTPRPQTPRGVLSLVSAVSSGGALGPLGWTALKVGALSFGGGFVIIPLMQGDAVHVYHWMSGGQFLDAVALGQVTPGPVVATVAAVGYAASGVGGGLFAAAVAFAPSFVFVLLGARRFEDLRRSPEARAFLDGAGPAAIGAILGAAATLTVALSEAWQFGVLALAAAALLGRRLPVPVTLLAAAGLGVLAALSGAPLPR
ncbi:MAG: chromate efflux transporter [Solirubrobacteraceae bacterium]